MDQSSKKRNKKRKMDKIGRKFIILFKSYHRWPALWNLPMEKHVLNLKAMWLKKPTSSWSHVLSKPREYLNYVWLDSYLGIHRPTTRFGRYPNDDLAFSFKPWPNQSKFLLFLITYHNKFLLFTLIPCRIGPLWVFLSLLLYCMSIYILYKLNRLYDFR